MLKRINRGFYYFSLVFLMTLLCLAFVYAVFTIPDKEKIFLSPGYSYIFYSISGSIIIGLLICYGYKKISCQSRYILTAGIIFGTVIILQIVVAAIQINPITDCFTTIDQAIAMLSKQNGILDNEIAYFERYTNNYFFTVLMYYYFKIIRLTGIDYFTSAVILNIICIDCSLFACYRLTGLLFGKGRALGTLFLMALCPTTYVFVSFPYTNTFSAPFVIGVLYYAIRLTKSDVNIRYKLLNICGLVFCGAFGTLIRPTTVIAVIAVIIYIILKNKPARIYLTLVSVVLLMILSFAVGSMFVKSHLKNRDNTGGFPATHWIMMGLNDKGFITGEDVEYTKSFPTKSEKIKGNMEIIRKRVSSLGAAGVIKLYAKKIGELWGVGTDDYNIHHSSAVTYTDVYELVYGNNCSWLIMYCQMFRIISLFMALILVISLLRRNSIDEVYLIALTLLGIMVFLMLWETNRKHNICFIPVLVLLMESGFSCFVKNKIRKNTRVILAGAVMILFVVSDILFVAEKTYFTDAPRNVKDYSVFRLGNRFKKIHGVLQKEKLVEQTFSTNKSFNTVALHFNPKEVVDEESYYRISLYKDSKSVHSVIIGVSDLAEEGWYYMQCEESPGNYLMTIEGESGNYDTMEPLMMQGTCMVPYRGCSLSVDGKESRCSLSFNVYNDYSDVIMSEFLFWSILISIIVLQITLAVISKLYVSHN